MTWHQLRIDSQKRMPGKFDQAEVASYFEMVGLGQLTRESEERYLKDIAEVFSFQPGMSVLDAGAGTGVFSRLLTRIEGLQLTALEPSHAMLEVLHSIPELQQVHKAHGTCDMPEDVSHFFRETFDVIVSRQLFNGLHDPLQAFANWHRWLKPQGTVLLIDGTYGRDAWRGAWAEEIDLLPASCCQTLGLAPYLLEKSGYSIAAVQFMNEVNQDPYVRTPRYLVVATKLDSDRLTN